jgi:hypothetical protein
MRPDAPFYRGLFFGISLSVALVWGPLAVGIYVLAVAR